MPKMRHKSQNAKEGIEHTPRGSKGKSGVGDKRPLNTIYS